MGLRVRCNALQALSNATRNALQTLSNATRSALQTLSNATRSALQIRCNATRNALQALSNALQSLSPLVMHAEVERKSKRPALKHRVRVRIDISIDW